jgi:hypothetical protein
MIESNGKNADGKRIFEVSCDRCSYQEEFEVDDWGHLMDELRDSGWKLSGKLKDWWTHLCPDCGV